MARLKIGQKPALDDMAAGVVAQRWEETVSDASKGLPGRDARELPLRRAILTGMLPRTSGWSAGTLADGFCALCRAFEAAHG
jgi:hypothetical protein